jgi:hypothetical protein
MMVYKLASVAVFAVGLLLLTPTESAACPICFGYDPGSNTGQAVNWAVFSLLGVTGGVLSAFVGFIFHLIKRSRMALGQAYDQDQGERFDG